MCWGKAIGLGCLLEGIRQQPYRYIIDILTKSHYTQIIPAVVGHEVVKKG